jgi:hypothetical protein
MNRYQKGKRERFGQRFAKEVGMGDPAEENDPPPESAGIFAKTHLLVNSKFARL